MAQLMTIKLSKSQGQSWGFRLQGGKDFATPLCIQKVNAESLAANAGLQAGDAIVSIGNSDALSLRHKEAQDTIVRSGNVFDLVIQRGANLWKPHTTVLPEPVATSQGPVATKTSLKAGKQDSAPIGARFNTAPAPFGEVNGIPIAPSAYNSPINIYSEDNIAETLSAQAEVLGKGGVLGVNFMKNDRNYDGRSSDVLRMVQEMDSEPVPPQTEDGTSPGNVELHSGFSLPTHDKNIAQGSSFKMLQAALVPNPSTPASPVSFKPKPSFSSVSAPKTVPSQKSDHLQPGENICSGCGRLIIGVFVRIKDKNLHAECFKCATCGTTLKNVGYYNINEKLYCDVHAKQAAKVNAPGPNMVPVTVNPGGALPAGAMTGQQVRSKPQPEQPVQLPVSPPCAPAPVEVPCPAPQSPAPAPEQFNEPTEEIVADTLRQTSPPPPRVQSPLVEPAPSFQAPPPAPAPIMAAPKPAPAPVSAPLPKLPQNFGAPSGEFNFKSLVPKKGTDLPFEPMAAPKQAPAPVQSFMPSVAPAPVQSFMPNAAPAPAPSFMPKPGGMGGAGPGGSVRGVPMAPGHRTAPRRGRGIMTQSGGARIPMCGNCKKQIRGPFVNALGKTWCPDHFVCHTESCRKPLIEMGFVEEQGALHCEDCYEKYLAPICGKCDRRVKGDCLNAVGKQFHPECFCCAYCGKVFGSGAFYLEDGLPYCETDWNDLFTTKCVGCNFPIEAGDRWVEALNNNYHSQCFKCSKCQKNLEGQSFFAKGGKPFCKAHAQRGF